MTTGGPRMTIPTQLVLRALLAEPGREMYGAELGEAAGLHSGTVHPMLARLERAGWVESRWEEIDPRVEGRPARRYYRLSAEGVRSARAALAASFQGRRRLQITRAVGEPS